MAFVLLQSPHPGRYPHPHTPWDMGPLLEKNSDGLSTAPSGCRCCQSQTLCPHHQQRWSDSSSIRFLRLIP